VIGSYSCSGNVIQGGGIDQYGNSSAIMNFEIAAQGMGGKYVLDGTDTAAAMFNPEGDAGDVEMWELISPMLYLSRRLKASSGGPGRHRGGSSFESLLVIWKTPFWELQNLGTTRVFSAQGLFGGYPGSAAYVHNIKGADLLERARNGEAYPLCDGDWDRPALMEIGGERTYKQDNFTTLEPFDEGDLYLSVMKGAPGLGDPLLRPPEAVAEDVRDGHLLPRFAGSVYGVVLRDDGEADVVASESRREEMRRERLDRAKPVREWWRRERERVMAEGFDDPVKVCYAESMRLSARFAAEFRGFWDLPEDFQVDAETPTVSAERAEPGKVTPEQVADEFLASSRVEAVEPPRAGGGTLERETLAAMLDEKLSRREIKTIQSGYKDPDRFEKWVAVLQERVPYDDPIVLPMGEGLNAVRRTSNPAAPGGGAEEAAGSGSGLVVRCDCGHDFCPPSRNWKMEAVIFVRDDLERLLEVYPRMAHCDPEWMELRELYCPSCARQLETEAVPPGYPVVHEFLPDIEGFYRGWLGREVP
jgi:acetone carboxylase gamma subunit